MFHFLVSELGQILPENCNQTDDLMPGTHILLKAYPEASEQSQKPFGHRYMSNNVCYRICTAFEIRVRAQSMCAIDIIESDDAGTSSSTTFTDAASTSIIGATATNSISNKLWTTKEANACILTALLLCLVPV